MQINWKSRIAAGMAGTLAMAVALMLGAGRSRVGRGTARQRRVLGRRDFVR